MMYHFIDNSHPIDTYNYVVLAETPEDAKAKLHSWLVRQYNKTTAARIAKHCEIETITDCVVQICQSFD